MILHFPEPPRLWSRAELLTIAALALLGWALIIISVWEIWP